MTDRSHLSTEELEQVRANIGEPGFEEKAKPEPKKESERKADDKKDEKKDEKKTDKK